MLDATLLIADDDVRFFDSLNLLLADRRIVVFRAASAADVLHQLAVNSEIEVVLLDRDGRPGPPESPGIGEVVPPPRPA